MEDDCSRWCTASVSRCASNYAGNGKVIGVSYEPGERGSNAFITVAEAAVAA